MTDPATLVPPEKVARKLRLPQPYPADVLEDCTEAIAESFEKVMGYLNRSDLDQRDVTMTSQWPDDRYDLMDVKAWPDVSVETFDEQYAVKSYVTNAADPNYYDVTFTVGLPQEARDAVARFITADAALALRTDPLFTAVARVITSVSAEGQSVSYEKAPAQAGATGSVIALDSLRRWRRLVIGRGTAARTRAPWPYVDRI